MAGESNSLILPTAAARPVLVDQAIQKLHIVRPVWLRRMYLVYPLILAAALCLDLVLWNGAGLIYHHLPRLLSYLAVLLAFLLFVRLYDQLPATLRALWDRGCLKSKTNEGLRESEYTAFLEQFDKRLNSVWSWVLGIAFVLLANVIPFDNVTIQGADWMVLGLAAFSYFLNGVGLWKLVIVAYTTLRLPVQFRIRVQPAHPDESGGLGPIGDLCFTNALILLGPALYFVAWVAYASSPEIFSGISEINQQMAPYSNALHQGAFHIILLAILACELLVFLLPLYQIHREMVRQAAAHHQGLDALAQRMAALNLRLMANIETLDPAEVRKSMEEMKSLRDMYEHNAQVPTWPFKRSVVLKFLSSQIVPLLSLTGLAKPIIDALGGLVR